MKVVQPTTFVQLQFGADSYAVEHYIDAGAALFSRSRHAGDNLIENPAHVTSESLCITSILPRKIFVNDESPLDHLDVHDCQIAIDQIRIRRRFFEFN